jgi:hypothetical protein
VRLASQPKLPATEHEYVERLLRKRGFRFDMPRDLMKESSVLYEKANRLTTPVSGIYDLVSQYFIRALLPQSSTLRN